MAPRSPYDVESPEEFADFITGPHVRWSDEATPIAEDDVQRFTNGMSAHFRGSDYPAQTALSIYSKAENAGLRAEIDGPYSITVLYPWPTCEEEGCYADATKDYNGDVCPAHARERKQERRRQGLPPKPGRDY